MFAVRVRVRVRVPRAAALFARIRQAEALLDWCDISTLRLSCPGGPARWRPGMHAWLAVLAIGAHSASAEACSPPGTIQSFLRVPRRVRLGYDS